MKRLPILFALFLFAVSCVPTHQPSASQARGCAIGTPLPIDGVYTDMNANTNVFRQGKWLIGHKSGRPLEVPGACIVQTGKDAYRLLTSTDPLELRATRDKQLLVGQGYVFATATALDNEERYMAQFSDGLPPVAASAQQLPPAFTDMAAAMPVQAASAKVALIVGNAAYAFSPLKNPANDATDIAAALRRLGFAVTLKTNASLREMESAIARFGEQLKKGGVGLFYYAGHGVQVNGINYLIPIGANIVKESDVKYEAMDVGKILDEMSNAANSLNIVILDACRDNPFARSYRSASRGLAKMDAPTGTLIAYATAPGSTAIDGDGRNGLYTKHLLGNLAAPGLKIEDVLKRVRVGVMEETKKFQVPWESSSLTGDFYFVNEPDLKK
jgi:hypothetical protein